MVSPADDVKLDAVIEAQVDAEQFAQEAIYKSIESKVKQALIDIQNRDMRDMLIKTTFSIVMSCISPITALIAAACSLFWAGAEKRVKKKIAALIQDTNNRIAKYIDTTIQAKLSPVLEKAIEEEAPKVIAELAPMPGVHGFFKKLKTRAKQAKACGALFKKDGLQAAKLLVTNPVKGVKLMVDQFTGEERIDKARAGLKSAERTGRAKTDEIVEQKVALYQSEAGRAEIRQSIRDYFKANPAKLAIIRSQVVQGKFKGSLASGGGNVAILAGAAAAATLLTVLVLKK